MSGVFKLKNVPLLPNRLTFRPQTWDLANHFIDIALLDERYDIMPYNHADKY
jgi:hypothetical protein